MIQEKEFQSLQPYRARGIDKLALRIGDITKDIDTLLKHKKKIRILEVGFGFGTVLVQLAKRYGKRVELHGISKTAQHGSIKDLRKSALQNGIATKEELKEMEFHLKYADVSQSLPYTTNSFDFIYSQVAFYYFDDKAKFIEELNRILTKNGVAKIDVNIEREDLPPKYRPCLEIWDQGNEIDFWKYIKPWKTLSKRKAPLRSFLEVRKAKQLKLGLELVATVNVNTFLPEKYGTKSIYRVH